MIGDNKIWTIYVSVNDDFFWAVQQLTLANGWQTTPLSDVPMARYMKWMVIDLYYQKVSFVIPGPNTKDKSVQTAKSYAEVSPYIVNLNPCLECSQTIFSDLFGSISAAFGVISQTFSQL